METIEIVKDGRIMSLQCEQEPEGEWESVLADDEENSGDFVN